MQRFATTALAVHVSGGGGSICAARCGRTVPAAIIGREALCRACERALRLGLSPLRMRELGAQQLVREVHP